MNIDWNDIPAAFNYIAMDANGEAFAYTQEPDLEDDFDMFNLPNSPESDYIEVPQLNHYWKYNWKNSVVKRPIPELKPEELRGIPETPFIPQVGDRAEIKITPMNEARYPIEIDDWTPVEIKYKTSDGVVVEAHPETEYFLDSTEYDVEFRPLGTENEAANTLRESARRFRGNGIKYWFTRDEVAMVLEEEARHLERSA